VTIQYTTNYQIAYADQQTALEDLATVTQQVAQSLDTAMGKAGYTPPDATDFAALSARVSNIATAVGKAPIIYTDTGVGSSSVNGAAATPTVVHASRTIDPVALFGAGFGALVRVDAIFMLDYVSGAAAQWYLYLQNGATPAEVTRDVGYLGSSGAQTRLMLRAIDEYVVPTGSTLVTQSGVDAAGAVATAKSYADARNNRRKIIVKPIPPAY